MEGYRFPSRNVAVRTNLDMFFMSFVSGSWQLINVYMYARVGLASPDTFLTERPVRNRRRGCSDERHKQSFQFLRVYSVLEWG